MQKQQQQLYLFVIGEEKDSVRITIGRSMSGWYLSHENEKPRKKIPVDECIELIDSCLGRGQNVEAAVNGIFHADARFIFNELKRVILLRRTTPRRHRKDSDVARGDMVTALPLPLPLSSSIEADARTTGDEDLQDLPQPADDLLAIFREKKARDLRSISAQDLLRDEEE